MFHLVPGVGALLALGALLSRVPLVRRVVRLLAYLVCASPAAIYSRQWQYITVKRLDMPSPEVFATGTASDTECLMVDSVEALQAVGWEIPESFRDSVMELGKRVSRGCVVCLARRPRADGVGKEVVGYEIAERRVFSALGRRIAVADEVIFSHYAEVLPEYRGQRIHGLMFAARDAYFRERGGRVVAGACLPDNAASLSALRRDGAFIAGTVERISLLRGRFVWDTPVAHIDTALARRGAAPKPSQRKRSVRVAVRRRSHVRVTVSSTTP